MNNATLVLLGIYHGQANPDRISISDIDTIIKMANEFDDRHGDTNWEDTDTDWADTLAQWYNDTKQAGWNEIPMVENDPCQKIKQEMGRFLSLDEPSDYDKAIASLKKALKSKKKRDELIDNIEGITVWQKVEYTFTVKEFCDLIGLTNN